jgi:predicted MPP superfamily phosphohydrolase
MFREVSTDSHVNRQLQKWFLIVTLQFTFYFTFSQQMLVPPYIQPGNSSSFSREEKIVIWQTDSVPGTYKVEYTEGQFTDNAKASSAKISSVKLFLNDTTTILYRARLPRLKFDELYTYRVSLNNKPIAENTFSSRTEKSITHFVVFGDCGQGTPEQAQIAYQVYQQKPQFVLIAGDNVYSDGLESEYRTKFFPYYLADKASMDTGAPLMNSVPFYLVVGNHDLRGADLDKHPGGLAYFYYNDLPLNGPFQRSTIEASGDPGRVKAFNKSTGSRFPRMTNFSFDYGNVHMVCLDANDYVNPLNTDLVEWLKNDLRSTQAEWRIVTYHEPAFSSSAAHYDYQIMRLLSPVLEKLDVDLVLAGHVHNYQRSVPLKFSPKTNEAGTQYLVQPNGRIDGTFTLDQQYDGVTNTRPDGIIYIVTGAGGAALYDVALSEKPELWSHQPPENWSPFTAKIISDKHSFTLIETKDKQLLLRQIDGDGATIDEIKITK